jgi:ABC-type branched-subunit amino acid transport system substrate-binding protein
MPRTAASFTQADIARAIRAAKAEGMRVRLLPSGAMVIEPPAEAEAPIAPPTAPAEPPEPLQPTPCTAKPLVF